MKRKTAAQQASAGGWGQVASDTMARYAERRPTMRRRCPRCLSAGVTRTSTHTGCTNGVALMDGCEFHVTQWVREWSG